MHVVLSGVCPGRRHTVFGSCQNAMPILLGCLRPGDIIPPLCRNLKTDPCQPGDRGLKAFFLLCGLRPGGWCAGCVPPHGGTARAPRVLSSVRRCLGCEDQPYSVWRDACFPWFLLLDQDWSYPYAGCHGVLLPSDGVACLLSRRSWVLFLCLGRGQDGWLWSIMTAYLLDLDAPRTSLPCVFKRMA